MMKYEKIISVLLCCKSYMHSSKYFAKLVDNKAIAENDYNIAVLSYVVADDAREVVDITELNMRISKIVARQNELRTAIDAIVADIEGTKI